MKIRYLFGIPLTYVVFHCLAVCQISLDKQCNGVIWFAPVFSGRLLSSAAGYDFNSRCNLT
jgi:hypothetical protein